MDLARTIPADFKGAARAVGAIDPLGPW